MRDNPCQRNDRILMPVVRNKLKGRCRNKHNPTMLLAQVVDKLDSAKSVCEIPVSDRHLSPWRDASVHSEGILDGSNIPRYNIPLAATAPELIPALGCPAFEIEDMSLLYPQIFEMSAILFPRRKTRILKPQSCKPPTWRLIRCSILESIQ